MPTDRVRTVMVILFLAALFFGSLAGCGGGGGSPGDTTNSPIKLQASSGGGLAVTIGSLPSGTAAFVQVTGPGNYIANLGKSQTLENIAPGDYTITAQPVVSGTSTWVPSPAMQTVTVTADATAAASVNYTVQETVPGVQPGAQPGCAAGTSSVC
jgi:hypothetical protein